MSNSLQNMSEEEFAHIFHSIREKILEDPIKNFVEAKNLINFSPTPAQKVAFKVIFGKELDSETKHEIHVEEVSDKEAFCLGSQSMTEVELYKYMTGFDYSKNDNNRNLINLIVGRRGGKSTLSAIIALFSTLKINWKPFLQKTPVATVLVLSHSVEFSEEILDILRNMVEDSPILSKLRDLKKKNTTKIFHLKIPFLEKNEKNNTRITYSRVRVKVGAASKKTTRGSAVCTLLCDEIAFWNLAENAAESDTDILRAVSPALIQFGEHATTIKLSSPGIKQGSLYSEWSRREDLQDIAIQFKAPSWVWNTILPKEEFYKEWKKDSEGFDTEFRANFVDSISNFISPEYVELATMKGVRFLPPSDDIRTTYSAAIDAAFKSDKFAFSLVGYDEKRVTSYITMSWDGSKKEPVKAHEVAKTISVLCRQYGVSDVAADQYSFQPLREIFEQYGLNLIENTFSLPYKRKIYFGLKRLIHNQQMDLLDNPVLLKEIKELQVEQTNAGQIRIGHPVGGSDDCSDSLAVATYHALEKAGVSGMVLGSSDSNGLHGIKLDHQGRAYSAPHPEMLMNYQGFQNIIDNSGEYQKDPESGKLRKIIELEEEGLADGDASFIF